MRLRHLLNSTLIVAATAAPALADVTAADVWDNTKALYAATGATVTGTPRVDGDATIIDDGALLYTFPFGAGTITATLPPLRLVENGDGTVTMADLGAFDFAIDINIVGEDPIGATVTMTQTDYSGTVSGTPQEMVYDYSTGPYTVALKDLRMPEEGMTVDMDVSGEGYATVTTVTTGDLITVQSNSSTLPLDVRYVISAGEEFELVSEANYGDTTSDLEMALQPGGANIMNLTPAFAAGMLMQYEATTTGNTSRNTTTIDGRLVSDQAISSGMSVALFSLSQAGLDLSATVQNVAASINEADLMPFPVDVEIAGLTAGYSFPVMASTDLQDISFDMVLDGLRMSPEIWAMFDPNKDLPREPATIALNMTGTVLSSIDLFDVMALEDKLNAWPPALTVETLNVSNLDLAAIGGSLNGSAEMTLDYSDFTTYDGFPKPVGDAFFEVSGANAVLDRLSQAGILREDEANAARFGMGFFARSTGDDSFETTVEFGEDGGLSVNGQRIR